MRKPRENAMTPRCAWCALIRVGQTWKPERRSAFEVIYTHGICDRCMARLLREGNQPSAIKWFTSEGPGCNV